MQTTYELWDLDQDTLVATYPSLDAAEAALAAYERAHPDVTAFLVQRINGEIHIMDEREDMT